MRRTRYTCSVLAAVLSALLLVVLSAPAQAASSSAPQWWMSSRAGHTPVLQVQLSHHAYGAGYSNPGSGHYNRVLSGGIKAGTHAVPTKPLGCNDSISWQGSTEVTRGVLFDGKIFTFQRKCGHIDPAVNNPCPVGADKQFRVAVEPTKGVIRNVNDWTLRRQDGSHLYAAMRELSDGSWEGFVTAPARTTRLDLQHPGGTTGIASFVPNGAVSGETSVTSNCINSES